VPAEIAARNLLALPRLLRGAGVPVDAERARLLLRAVAAIGLDREEDVRAAARAALVSRAADLAEFERVFDLYLDLLRRALPSRAGSGSRHRPAVRLATGTSTALPGRSGSPVGVGSRAAASPEEILRHTDFAAMTAEERVSAEHLMERLVWTPGLRRGRRFRPATAGPRPDARATLRRSLRTWGETVELHRRAPRPRRRPLVLLCDVSASMEPYVRVLLHLTHALSQGWGQVEAFTFGTRLTRITADLRHRRTDVALGRISRTVPDRSGGTRIGESLREFNLRWSRRVLGRGAMVLLCSDGWERGDAELLASEAERLQRAAYRLIWLDPLAGTTGYAPEAGGARILAARVDDHLVANTLASLDQVAALLGRAGRGRPRRRQAPMRR
jgi:uncharacterized protein